MTLRQKQKVAVLFTKMSTLTPKNVQPPPLGPPSTERPPKRRILLGAHDVYSLPCEFGVDRPTRFRDMDYAIVPSLTQCKNSTPSPRGPHGPIIPELPRSRPWCLLYLSQNFTPIAPSCVEISSTVQTNKQKTKKNKLNITPTLRGMAR